MTHHTSRRFRDCYNALPDRVRKEADEAFVRLQSDPQHTSLRFKRVGQFWSARVGRQHRALAVEVDDGLLWVWIGNHDEYDRLIAQK